MNSGILRLTKSLPLVPSQRGIKSLVSTRLVTEFFKKGQKEPVGPADPIEHATGPFKAQLMLAEMGISDPFLMQPLHHDGTGMTKDNPHLVLMLRGISSRIIACQCEHDQTYFNYMWVDNDECRRCECGLWFKGVEIPHPYEYLPKLSP